MGVCCRLCQAVFAEGQLVNTDTKTGCIIPSAATDISSSAPASPTKADRKLDSPDRGRYSMPNSPAKTIVSTHGGNTQSKTVSAGIR